MTREEAADVLQNIFVGAPDDRANEALMFAIAELRKGAWQPIETAPKDECRSILVHFPEIGAWRVFWFDGIWCLSDNRNEPRPLRGWSVQPTHWMPLPAPPTTPATGGQ